MAGINRANIRKTIYYLQRNGWKNTFFAALERLQEKNAEEYAYEAPSEETLAAQRSAVQRSEVQGSEVQCGEVHDIEAQCSADQNDSPQHSMAQNFKARMEKCFGKPVCFSILVPVYRTNSVYFTEMIESVQAQTYPYWELILADATEDDSIRRQAEGFAADDQRIRYFHLEQNEGISANSNAGLAHVTGTYVGLLDHDDVLTPDALYENALRICAERECGNTPKLLYSDEDKCNGDRTLFYEPHKKEDFNLDLFLSNNYICHFTVLDKELIEKLQFRREYDGAQDYDLFLRAVSYLLWEEKAESAICHIPKVLYHWRCHTGSTAENPQSKQYAYEAGLRALQSFADERGWQAKAVHLRHLGFYGLQYRPSVFAVRNDIGVIGGKLLQKGKICGGRLAADGTVFYEGLPHYYTGYLHRAVLAQDAEAVDLRLMRVRRECIPVLERALGVTYRTLSDGETFDVSCLPEGSDLAGCALRFGAAVRAAGYRILWDPVWEKRV